MFSVNDFLDRAKRGAKIDSDYALAKAIGVSRANVSNWRNERNAPDGRAILALCALSGDDPEHVAACIQSMRAANDDEAELWRRVAARLKQHGAASVVLTMTLVGLTLSALSQNVQAAPDLLAGSGGLCIMSTVVLARLLARVLIRKAPVVRLAAA